MGVVSAQSCDFINIWKSLIEFRLWNCKIRFLISGLLFSSFEHFLTDAVYEPVLRRILSHSLCVSFLFSLFCCLRCVQDVQIEREKQIYNVTGGCTALTVVYLQGKLYVANAGDSRFDITAKTWLPVVVFSLGFVWQGSLFFHASAEPLSSGTMISSLCRRSSRPNLSDSDFSF